MEIILIVLLGLAILGFPIWVIVRINTLTSEIRQLKAHLRSMGTSGTVAPPQPAVSQIPVAQNNSFAPQTVQQPYGAPASEFVVPAYADSEPNAFVVWITEDVFMKLGALLLLMGFGWFVSYAFINNWIGPVGRISLGVLAGVAIMGAGTWRVNSYRHQGSVLLVLGSGIVLLTLFAAREMYDFLTPGISLVVMFMSVAYVAFVSVLYQSDKLALAGLVMAAVAPLLTSQPDPSIIGLMSYLLVVVVGTIWVVRLTGSHILTFAAVVMMLLYSLPFLGGGVSEADEQIALLFSFIFAGIFFVTNTISIIKVQTDTARKGQIFSAIFTGLYILFWVGLVVASNLQSLAYVFWMLIFSVGTFAVYTQTVNRIPFFIYGAVTVGLLFAATAAELSGPVLTLAYTAEITALLILARQFIAKHISEKLVWLFALPVVLSLESFASRAWSSGFMHWDFVTLVLVGGALGLVGFVYLQTREEREAKNHFAEILLGTSFLYMLSLVWLVLHSVLSDDIATTMSLIIYTVLGLGFFIAGQLNDRRLWQICGGILLGGVVLRLLLIDVWQMDLVGRIITFFVVGTLLISTAFIKKSKKETEIIQ